MQEETSILILKYIHRSFDQKDYKLNHINNSCSVWNATYFHKVCAFSINGYIDI